MTTTTATETTDSDRIFRHLRSLGWSFAGSDEQDTQRIAEEWMAAAEEADAPHPVRFCQTWTAAGICWPASAVLAAELDVDPDAVQEALSRHPHSGTDEAEEVVIRRLAAEAE